MAVLRCTDNGTEHDIQSVSFVNPNNGEVFLNPYKLFDAQNGDVFDGSICYPVCRLRVVSMDFNEGGESVLINGCPAKTDDLYTIELDSVKARTAEFERNVPRQDAKEDGNFLISSVSGIHPIGSMDVFIYVSRNVGGASGIVPDGKYFRVIFTKSVLNNGTEHFRGSGVSMTDTNSSFLLMRSDPRLSGNVKLVCDKEGRLYLDTFHVTENLSRREYRHVSVSANSRYSTDVRNVFSHLSSEDLYANPEISLRPHAVATDYSEQYDSIYFYGAETNSDEMYSENYSVLAPLWLNKVIPDFFAVFRVDGPMNQNSYETSLRSSSEVMRSFLKEGVTVKVFDLREGSPLGDYIRNYYKEISMYTGSMYLQFVEREEPDEHRNGINSWIGISVDRGEVVKMDEVSWFTEESIAEGSQERFSQFLTDGFKRNRLICPHLINLQFMFDDPDVETYSMNRYFGLYLKENDIIRYDFLESALDEGTGNLRIGKYGTDHAPIDDRFLRGSNGLLTSGRYDDRLFFAVTKDDAVRVKDYNSLNTFIRKNAVNTPSVSLFSSEARRVINPGHKSFITFTVTKPIRYGEHFRVCIPTYSEDGESMSVVLEVIASNDERLASKEDFVSPYVTVNNRNYDTNYYVWYRHNDLVDGVKPKQDNYYMADTGQNKYTEFRYMEKVRYSRNGAVFDVRESDRIGSHEANVAKYPYIFRMCFYTQDEDDHSVLAGVDEQIKRIARCFDVFAEELNIGVTCKGHSGDAVSIVSDYSVTYFQHLTADILEEDYYTQYQAMLDEGLATEEAYLKVECEEDDGIRYFGATSVSVKTHPLSNDSNLYYSDSIMFAPLNFENLGWRRSSIVRMCSFGSYLYETDVEDMTKLMGNSLIRLSDGTYKRLSSTVMKDYAVATNGVRSRIYEYSNELLLVRLPFNPSKWFVMCDDELSIPNNRLNFFSPVSVSLSLMGIMPVKDLDCGFSGLESEMVSSNVPITIPTDTLVSIGNRSEHYILPGVFYDIKMGSIAGLNRGSGFVIIDGILYYGNEMDGVIRTMEVGQGVLRTSAETVLQPRAASRTYDYTISPIEFSEQGFFENMDMASSLLYPLTVPSAVVWESVGRYYDGDSILRLENLDEYVPDVTHGYLTAYRPDAGGRLMNRGISHNMDSLVNVTDESGAVTVETFRKYLSDSMEAESMNLFLTEDAMPKYSVGYYNEYVNTLEFTAYGIRFSMSFDSTDYVRQIQLSNYSKYEVFVLLDYTSARNEMFINTIENVILIVCHNFAGVGSSSGGNLFSSPGGKSFSPNQGYGWMSTGIELELNGMEANASQLHIPLKEPSKVDLSDGKSLYQLNVYSEEENMFEKGHNSLVKIDSAYVNISDGSTYNESPNDGASAMFLNWDASELVSENASEKKTHVMKRSILDPRSFDETESRTYIMGDMSKDADIYKDYGSLREALIASLTQEDNYEIYIKHKNGYDVVTDHMSTSADYKPISISCSVPTHVKYLADFYNPHFVNIMGFALNEDDDLIRATGKNFVLCDTCFEKVSGIGGLFGRKVFTTDTNVSLGGSKNNLYRSSRDVTMSDWDKGFFRRYSSDGNSYADVDGYMTGVDMRSFFGSRCISLSKAEFEITDWNATNVSTVVVEKERIIVTVNLTRAFVMYFLSGNESVFTDNWRYFRYNSDSMNNYVKKSLTRHFKINNRNDFSLYSCSTELNPTVHLTTPSNSAEYEKVQNFESTYSVDNEEVVMTIILRDVNKSYYFSYKMASSIG